MLPVSKRSTPLGKLHSAYLTCDSAVVVEVIQCESPFLPVVFFDGHITLQFLRNTDRGSNYLKPKSYRQRRLGSHLENTKLTQQLLKKIFYSDSMITL